MNKYHVVDNQAKSTRDRVLQNLLSRERCTINELAKAVDINPISVRHHIARLEAEGLVESYEEKHGVGRPRRLYFLTDAGKEHFPTQYLNLTIRLLEQLKDTLPAELIDRLFTQMALDMASDHSSALEQLPLEKRIEEATHLLQKEGFNVEWEKNGKEYYFKEMSCPYLQISQKHQEVCSIGQTLISTLVSVPAKKIKCINDGDSQCVFLVSEEATLK